MSLVGDQKLGEKPARLWVAEDECHFTPVDASVYVKKKYDIDNKTPQKLSPSDMQGAIDNWIGAGIFYAKVLSDGPGQLVFERIPLGEIQGGATLLKHGEPVRTDGFTWIKDGKALPILVDANEDKGVLRAVNNLQLDAFQVTGATPEIIRHPSGKQVLIIGTLESSQWIKELVQSGKINKEDLEGKREKYILTTLQNPVKGIDEAVVIAGSDKRGAIYGIYELSLQMGVSPWYYWADAPIQKHNTISFKSGSYTDGEPDRVVKSYPRSCSWR